MRLGRRMWNLSGKSKTQLFIFPHLSWARNILDVTQWPDAKMHLPCFSGKSQDRGNIPSGCEHPGKTDHRVWQMVYQAWHQPWVLLKWLMCLLSLWASLQGKSSSFCSQGPPSWLLLWAWDCFSVHPDMTLSPQNKPYYIRYSNRGNILCHYIR